MTVLTISKEISLSSTIKGGVPRNNSRIAAIKKGEILIGEVVHSCSRYQGQKLGGELKIGSIVKLSQLESRVKH